MPQKIKIAMNWGAACGGCDVSILDAQERIFELTDLADFVYWPVAMDFKRKDLLALPAGSIDIGLFNGAVRTSEQQQDAQAQRKRSKVLVAYGTCACFGGIPGLANLASRKEIFDVAYDSTPSTHNADGVRPQIEHRVGEHTLHLPSFHDTVASLRQVVDVDIFVPGCPPPTSSVLELINVASRYAQDGTVPSRGTVIASDKALCDVCPRGATRRGGRLPEIVRPHQTVADKEQCFLDQGMLCMGLATRGGCGHSCIAANMPCRGCFGPLPQMVDPAAEALSAFGSLAGAANENDVPPHEMKKAVRSIVDPVGSFYRFTLPTALFGRAVDDKPTEERT